MGAGGHFTMPAIWDTDTTAASEAYELSFTHEYDRNGDYFVPPCSRRRTPRYRVACTSPQTIHIALDPVE